MKNEIKQSNAGKGAALHYARQNNLAHFYLFRLLSPMGLFILFKAGKICGVTSPPGLDSQRVTSVSTWQRWPWC